MQNIYVVIVAGGTGERMGAIMPKQFLLLNNITILQHSVQAFINALPTAQIIIVLPQNHISYGKEVLQNIETKHAILYTVGGSTRFESVQNGLQFVQKNSIVFVHDAVRCLLTGNLIQACLQQAIEKGSAIPAITATDSIRLVDDAGNNTVYDRTKVCLIQTPQTFNSSVLLEAFQQPYQPLFTDEATVVEALGQKVFLIEGEHNNIKITRPLDLVIAEYILKERS